MNTLRVLKIAATAASLSVCLSAAAQTGAPPASTTADTAPAASSESLGQHISDSTITAKAKAQLIAAKDLKASRVHVKTRRGVVSLTGSVPSAADKTRAQQIVEGISGVRSVNNHLKVTEAGASE
ncbi:BON domain-containing protein [Trinickia caryophylli]|uniref:BON domain-containing protein n=1 Tax=Trinickia caryophylli TaxID=28094 RepID=A0A1X7GZ12_TRICW|nr:BON domain-containing protein [Trinickia caryophylli]PMS10096.1 BON domain-containing protein [Trinickia caryophylli]TRX18193.1 BON domain-containing protein [Trinickia caryophylli]WQE11017.1 BON domain-containing protein [Trinickia caryophylli]SMF76970.1 BON domain-containing protein [Trinickia caryophylli]GLU35366.1 hypothetical protein Busp01_52080 [Trinickia caryophylli]